MLYLMTKRHFLSTVPCPRERYEILFIARDRHPKGSEFYFIKVTFLKFWTTLSMTTNRLFLPKIQIIKVFVGNSILLTIISFWFVKLSKYDYHTVRRDDAQNERHFRYFLIAHIFSILSGVYMKFEWWIDYEKSFQEL